MNWKIHVVPIHFQSPKILYSIAHEPVLSIIFMAQLVVACNSILNIMIVTDPVVTLSFGYTTTSYAYTILSLSVFCIYYLVLFTIFVQHIFR